MRKIPSTIRKEVIRRLVDEFHPEVIYLFGSHAWGKPDAHSDMDVMVIVTNSLEKPIQRAVRAQHSLRGLKAPVDVLVKTRMEFERYTSVQASLEAQITREGKLLYGSEACYRA